MEKDWWVETYEKAIAYDKKNLEDIAREIKWLGNQIARERQRDKEMLVYIWAKGVLTETEMKYYGNPKKYVGLDTERYIKYREREYKRRAKALVRLAKDEEMLERVKGW